MLFFSTRKNVNKYNFNKYTFKVVYLYSNLYNKLFFLILWKDTQTFLPECRQFLFLYSYFKSILEDNLISSFAFTITSCTSLLHNTTSNSSIKPARFSQVRMNPLNDSLFAFLFSILAAMLSYKSLYKESVSQSIFR